MRARRPTPCAEFVGATLVGAELPLVVAVCLHVCAYLCVCVCVCGCVFVWVSVFVCSGVRVHVRWLLDSLGLGRPFTSARVFAFVASQCVCGCDSETGGALGGMGAFAGGCVCLCGHAGVCV